jgi:copper transport protein
VVASEGQVVVRLATPEAGNAYEPTGEPDYALSGQVRTGSGGLAPLRFRSCGTACFVGSHAWTDGDNVLSLEVRASGWRGGGFAALVPWPARPADAVVARTVRAMEAVEEVTIYEAGTSDSTTDLPPPDVLTLDGATLLAGEPYNAGVAPVAAVVRAEAGAQRLLMGFPSAGVYAAVTLDRRGRISEETLVGPSHVFERRFVYPDG